MASASASYSYLTQQGYLDGTTTPPLIDPNSTCLTWVSSSSPTANMPQGGGSNPQAVTDLKAWAAAGAKNN